MERLPWRTRVSAVFGPPVVGNGVCGVSHVYSDESASRGENDEEGFP